MPEPEPGARLRGLVEQLTGPRARQLVKRPAVRLTNLGTRQVTAGAAVVGLVVAAAAAALAGPWDASGQRKAERDWAAGQEAGSGLGGGADHAGDAAHGRSGGTSREAPDTTSSAPAVLVALGAPTPSGAVPTGSGLAALLDPLLKDPSLGSQRSAAVVDAATGEQIYGKDADTALTPASTTKLATAAAALSALGPDHRLTTRTVLADPGKVVLVGGGDPTLTAHKDAQGNASLRVLADRTASELKARHAGKVTVSYDASLYAGPLLHPIGPNENLAPVSALETDEGRLNTSSSGPAPRSADPAGDAARTFAGLLKERGVEAGTTVAPGRAPGSAAPLASVSSPPLADLVERMLTHSDNDIAEALARQVALASKEQASFEGGGRAVRGQLKALKLPLAGAAFADGSGLNRDDRLTANLLTSLLARAADPAHPELRPVLTGLPVAGFTGTLANRYASKGDAAGTGLVRAKTGTLTGVNTLAGTLVDADGRQLLFAFLTAGSTTPATTQATLDHLSTTLTTCGCH
ncbi:D-alanyl-D-alanine carboxypeptidase/D-alanyl-D-alanine endopeptidase [Streptomyces sp. NPDC002004]